MSKYIPLFSKVEQSFKGKTQPHVKGDGPTQSLGVPIKRKILDSLDIFATLVSICCFFGAAAVINPSLHLAALLGFNRQIVVLGLLISVETLCLQRVLPYALTLIEARYGRFTLQNVEGLLRSSPVASQLGLVWRLVLIILKVMPIALGVGYKQFIGGVAFSGTSVSRTSYGPAAPPGLQSDVEYSLRNFDTHLGKINAVMANATAPFLAASPDTVPFPKDLELGPKPYGFNCILISNTTAAAIDAPLPNRISELQNNLQGDSAYYLAADNLRGTMAKYNASIGDEAYWNQTFDITKVTKARLDNGYFFVMIQAAFPNSDDDARLWNGSWALAGTMMAGEDDMPNGADGVSTIPHANAMKFINTRAMRFDVKRHKCSGTWKITRSSVELQEGKCDPEPLEEANQIYDYLQVPISEHLAFSLAEYLGGFANIRNQSHWLIPTHVTVMALAFHSAIAGNEGFVPTKWNGPQWEAHNTVDWFNETYTAAESIKMSIPTLRDGAVLYFIIGLQPVMTILAVCAVACLFRIPISRNLGLVSLLAGVDRDTLDILKGAAYSGKLSEPVSIRIDVSYSMQEDRAKTGSVQYYVGQSGSHGVIRRQFHYN